MTFPSKIGASHILPSLDVSSQYFAESLLQHLNWGVDDELEREIHVLPSRTETAMPWSRHGDGGVLWSCERVAARIRNGSVLGLGLGWV
jgi:hypothetical protein